MRIFTTTLLLGVVVSSLHAQTAACTLELQRAEEAFEQGRLLDVLNNTRFMNCFEDFSIEEKIRANKLLTKTYIFTDNIAQAEVALVALLGVDKEHLLARTDPSELHFLYSQFRTEPIFRLGTRVSINKSIPVVLESFNTFQSGEKKYNERGTNSGLGIGVSFEALLERHIKNGIEVGLGTQLRIATYGVEGDLLRESGQLFYTVNNRSTMLRIPILGRYNFNYDKKDNEGVRLTKLPYFFLGASFDLTLNATYVSTDRTGGTAFTLNENNSLTEFEQVRNSNVSIFGGVGAKLRIGRSKVDFLTVEIRYDNSLFNYINPDNRFKNRDVNFDIGHVEDDLALNAISISAGYTISFYNPKKRKQYR